MDSVPPKSPLSGTSKYDLGNIVNGAFINVIKDLSMKSSLSLAKTQKPATSICIRRGKNTDTHKVEVLLEIETGARLPQIWEGQDLPEAGRREVQFSPRNFGRNVALQTPWFWTSGLRKHEDRFSFVLSLLVCGYWLLTAVLGH